MSDALRPPPPLEPEDEAKAVVERIGRWTYRVSIEHGIMTYGPGGAGWHVHGLERAQRKARRELERYKRKFTEKRERWEIT